MRYRVRTLAEREASAFRLIRCFDTEHNVRRLQAYIERIGKTPGMVRFARRTRLKRRVKALGRAATAKR